MISSTRLYLKKVVYLGYCHIASRERGTGILCWTAEHNNYQLMCPLFIWKHTF